MILVSFLFPNWAIELFEDSLLSFSKALQILMCMWMTLQMQILMQHVWGGAWACIFLELPGDTACPQTKPLVSGCHSVSLKQQMQIALWIAGTQ